MRGCWRVLGDDALVLAADGVERGDDKTQLAQVSLRHAVARIAVVEENLLALEGGVQQHLCTPLLGDVEGRHDERRAGAVALLVERHESQRRHRLAQAARKREDGAPSLVTGRGRQAPIATDAVLHRQHARKRLVLEPQQRGLEAGELQSHPQRIVRQLDATHSRPVALGLLQVLLVGTAIIGRVCLLLHRDRLVVIDLGQYATSVELVAVGGRGFAGVVCEPERVVVKLDAAVAVTVATATRAATSGIAVTTEVNGRLAVAKVGHGAW
mmetsp:Transcript_1911/g.6070  ORF Transcript_1911/g.6070 Transcript_1911/m.6070 type:complete len:269 (+) Transcript_1911:4621-5427(+)